MKHILWFVILLELSVLAVAAPAQSLADLARKERERRKAAVAEKTYTSADIAPAQPLPAAVPTVASEVATEAAQESKDAAAGPAKAEATPGEAKPVTAKPTGPADNKGQDEKYWRGEFATARTDLKRAQDQMNVIELKLNSLNTQMLRGSDIYNRENRIKVELDAANIELETARQEAEKARQKIVTLEEELRRSGGPIGWSR